MTRLGKIVSDFGLSLSRVDARRPQAANARTGALFQPGIGPHSESKAVELVARELECLDPATYGGRIKTGVPYPGQIRQTCDLCVGTNPDWEWAIEVKMLRMKGDNGKPNDNMLMHILSPYPRDRSALTDCEKLTRGSWSCSKAVMIYGFDYPDLPMDPAIGAFETLAQLRASLSARCTGAYRDLVHPVHQKGRVFGWEVQ